MTKLYMNLKTQQVIERVYDEVPENPREWDNLGTFYTWEDRSYSPDNHSYSDPLEFLSELLSEETVYKVHDKYNNTAAFMNDIMNRLDKKGYILYPVSKYEHGNVDYSIGCKQGWDSGTVGFIFATKKKIYECYGVNRLTGLIRNKVINEFKNELKTYTSYANGQVYGFILEDLQGNQVDSCYGFYDYHLSLKELGYEFAISDLNNWEEYDQNKLNGKFDIYTQTVKL